MLPVPSLIKTNLMQTFHFRFCKSNDDSKKLKVSQILERLINLTIEQKEMYPSIQAKIWGSIGQIPELIDMVLDNFIQKSVTSGLGSPQVEIMADTAVALASANVQLVAKKVIGRLCRVMDKTCTNPTQFLEQHMMWDDIAILARYLLMLSFNNCLDVARHLPYLFHTVTFLVNIFGQLKQMLYPLNRMFFCRYVLDRCQCEHRLMV